MAQNLDGADDDVFTAEASIFEGGKTNWTC